MHQAVILKVGHFHKWVKSILLLNVQLNTHNCGRKATVPAFSEVLICLTCRFPSQGIMKTGDINTHNLDNLADISSSSSGYLADEITNWLQTYKLSSLKTLEIFSGTTCKFLFTCRVITTLDYSFVSAFLLELCKAFAVLEHSESDHFPAVIQFQLEHPITGQ